ncbi:MAG: M28 family peptidase [Gemmatimonadota bacterium]|nr:M28 family peptidase [Gemmatimonadota bacterium]
MTTPFRSCLAALLALAPALLRAQPTRDVRPASDLARAQAGITAPAILRDITTLASDAFEGRAPGTRGEDSSVTFLQREFRRIGLRPGNPDGSYIQTVPLVGTTSTVTARASVQGTTIPLRQLDDIGMWSLRPDTLVTVTPSALVFVGYGVEAPEYQWDDFKGVDVRGKIVVMLVGDPPVRSASDSATLDPAVFRGPAMTYYGRWTYKYEQAAAKGAAGVILVHQTGPAGYPWTTVQSNAHEKFEIADGPAHAAVEGWMQLDVATRLFAAGGHDFAALERLARTRDFRPVALGGTAEFTVRNAVRRVQSRNVIARLDGSDAALRTEYVVLSAHWDGYGIGRAINGDSIYNGALDDASGVAWLLAQARAFASLAVKPKRTMLFLAVTAEEQGLLGSRWYGQHPLYPLERTLADINMDAMNTFGRTSSIVSLGVGQTSLETLLAQEAAKDGRIVKPDPESEKGYFYRADHFEFARQGVPALSFLFPGTDYINQPAGYEARVRGEYIARDYHKPSDEVKATWDLAGLVDDTRLLFRVALAVADGAVWPTWSAGSEFRARRERALQQAKTGATQEAATDAVRTPLSIERITGGPSLTGTSPTSPLWSPDSKTLAFLWNDAAQPTRSLWLVARDATTPRRLLPAADSAGVREFVWTPDGTAVVYVQRDALRRATVATGAVITLDAGAGDVSELAIAPDGRTISFLRDGDLWLLPIAGGTPMRATHVAVPPLGAIALGTYYGREVEIGGATWSGPTPSYAWSPDARTIAVHAVDRRAVPRFSMPYYLGDTVQLNTVRRGAPGQTNEMRTVALYDVGARTLSTVELPDASRTRVVNLAWSATGTLLIDRESDDAIDRTIHVLTQAAPTPRVAWRDHRDTRIYNDIASAWSADGRTIVLTGDLDDRYRLYHVTPGDSTPALLTPGAQDVAGAGIPRAATRSIDYVSSAPRPSERHVFRVSSGGGVSRQLTTMPGTHAPFVSPDGRTIALLSSSDLQPTELYLLDVRPGAVERRVTTSTPPVFATVPWIAPQYLRIPNGADTLPLHIRVFYPPQLDSTKRYPVLFGPVYSNTVRNRWGGLNGQLQQFLALEKGYIVVQVDVRGSTGYGREFREKFLMDWGGGDLGDLESAVTYMKTLPFVDPARFGIWGSSYGGTLTVYSLLKKPGLFQAGVAGAAATDPFLFGSDDVAIVRRPQTHPATFARGARQYAGNLRDHLLLIHGMQDDVVPFSSAVALAEEFMRLGKDFDFAVAPAATHAWTQRPYYAAYLWRKLVDHFDRYLGAGPR